MLPSRRLYPFYAASGCISLAYQVVWFRIFADRFGSTSLTFALVLSCFIGGLSLGSMASAHLSRVLIRRGWNDGLRVYGAAELAVGAAMLLTPLTASVALLPWSSFAYVEAGGVFEPVLWRPVWEVFLAGLAIGVPCFFMGTTFPLLCAVFGREAEFPAALYAWNTAGACVGVLLCEFLLLPWLGHEWTLWPMAAANLALGAYFLGRGGAAGEPFLPERARGEGTASADASALIALAVLSGLLAGALEGDLFRRIKFLGYSTGSALSFASFWAIAGIFLASTLVRLWSGLSLWHIKLGFVLLAIVYPLTWTYGYELHQAVVAFVAPAELESPAQWELSFPLGLTQLWLFTGVVVLPTFTLVSLLLPHVCNRLQAGARHLGVAYGLNTLAFCVGVVAFSWLLPRVSIFFSMKFCVWLLVVGVVFLLTVFPGRRLPPWRPLAAVAALALGFFAVPSELDRDYLLPDGYAAQNPIRAMRSNGAQTTFVVSAPGREMLFFENRSLSDTGKFAQIYMRLMAHFPLMIHPSPRSALLICYGVGNTASAIAAHDSIERIDVVELNRNVIDTAPEFAAATGAVHLDPRIRFIHDDGRSFLRLSSEHYDLITSEPPPPLHDGVYRLFSREYYRDARARLSENGLMSQWLPANQLPPRAVASLIATFIEVFPESVLLAGVHDDFVLVGSVVPLDLGRVLRVFPMSGALRDQLEAIRVHSGDSLLARTVQTGEQLRAHYGDEPVIRDAHNELAYLFVDLRRPAVVAYDPLAVLASPELRATAAGDSLDALVTHLGRLRYHVPGFPKRSLALVPASEQVALSGADWDQIERLDAAYSWARSQGRLAQAVSFLLRSLELASEQPNTLIELARVYLGTGADAQALEMIERFRALEPDDATGLWFAGTALTRLGRFSEGAERLRRALDLATPASPFAAQVRQSLSELERRRAESAASAP